MVRLHASILTELCSFDGRSLAGNHFFAYSIKSEFVDWLDPRPIPYADTDQVPIHFKGYLP